MKSCWKQPVTIAVTVIVAVIITTNFAMNFIIAITMKKSS